MPYCLFGFALPSRSAGQVRPTFTWKEVPGSGFLRARSKTLKLECAFALKKYKQTGKHEFEN